MDEKNWRVKRLEEAQKRYEETQKDHGKRLTDLEKFKYSTVEKLKTIFERLKALEKSNKWVSQSFFYLILSGVIVTVFSLIQWLITG
jgi:DNA repair exonuclease SbcCD ATPase subunit